MSDFITSHYDLNESRGQQMIVLDTFKNIARTIQNDVIPASREDVAVAGIENPASSLRKAGNAYTTVPLRPVSKDVNFIYSNFLHGRFKISWKLETFSDSAGTTAADLPANLSAALTLMNTACFFNRIQILLGNNIIYQNQFQRQESMVGMASLPQEVVETSPEFFTCSKVLNHSPIPGVYVSVSSANKTATGTYASDFILDFTVDLNHLTPLISNIPFTLIETGDLRLRLFMENLDEAFLIAPIPENLINADLLNQVNFHVVSPQPVNKLFCLYQPTVQAIASGANTIAAGTATSAAYMKFSITDWQAVDVGLEIIQSNFSIQQASRDALKSYLSVDNKIVLPTQTWSTAMSTNTPTSTSGELIFQLSAYNIYLLAFIFPYDTKHACYLPTPPLTNIDISLNSKSINYIPYKAIDSRVIKDTIQAFVNDDRYGANENLLHSLSLPISGSGAGYDDTAFKHVFGTSSRKICYYPNTFVLAKGLSPPNCFEKGYCYASSNPQSAQIRLKYSLQQDLETGAANTLNQNQSLTSTNSNAYCLALQDCCVVLDFNPAVGFAQSGAVVYAEPTVE